MFEKKIYFKFKIFMGYCQMKILGLTVHKRKSNQKNYASFRREGKQYFIYIGPDSEIANAEKKIKKWFNERGFILPSESTKTAEEMPPELQIDGLTLRFSAPVKIKVYAKKEKGRKPRRQAQAHSKGKRVNISVTNGATKGEIVKKIMKKLLEKSLIDFEILC